MKIESAALVSSLPTQEKEIAHSLIQTSFVFSAEKENQRRRDGSKDSEELVSSKCVPLINNEAFFAILESQILLRFCKRFFFVNLCHKLSILEIFVYFITFLV